MIIIKTKFKPRMLWKYLADKGKDYENSHIHTNGVDGMMCCRYGDKVAETDKADPKF